MRIEELPIVVFDTETTGLSPLSYVVELGGVRIIGDRMVDIFSTLVRPPVHIPPGVIRIHGINDEMVRHAPPFSWVIPQFQEFISRALLVAHNAPFDLKVLSINLQREGFPLWENSVLDTCKISRRYFPELISHSLVNLIQVWRSPFNGCHRALSDARHTAFIFLGMMKKFGITPQDRLGSLLSLFGPVDSMIRYQVKWEEICRASRKVEMLMEAVKRGEGLEVFDTGGVIPCFKRIYPLALYSTGDLHFVKALCERSGKVKTFRIDRIAYIKGVVKEAV